MNLTLSPRLQCIANYVLNGDRVIDVGTDHAYIPIWLLQNGVSAVAAATDIHQGPLNNAAKDAEKYQVADRLTLLLCDGLSKCSPDMAEDILIAGMGGETIMLILEHDPWALEKRLILQPQTKIPELRNWLEQKGLAIVDAKLVYDAGRIYLVWLVGKGEMRRCALIDPILIEKRDPLLRPYIEEQIKHLRKQIHGMELSLRSDPELLSSLRAQLAEISELHKEVLKWHP